MPTARELLEQADALMRKGRGAAGTTGHAPAPSSAAAVWPPVVPGATSPRTIQREPIAPSEALTAVPITPEPSVLADLTGEIVLPAMEPPDLAAAVDAAEVAAVEVPTLSDAVSGIELEGEEPAAGLADDGDDFPVLTEAVDADVVASVEEEPPARPEAGVAVEDVDIQQPSAAAAAPSGSEEIVEGGAEIPIAGFAPLGPQPGYDIRVSVDFEDVAASASAEATAGYQVAAAAPAADEEPAAPGTMPEEPSVDIEAGAPSGEPQRGDEERIDDERIDVAVDAIRMQVLQRIDIFTDTTLRARLGEELRPLVERASGELVAAINQHVGEWLRTYVAEVLEQEIERWRHGQR